MDMLGPLSHIALVVSNPDRTAEFFHSVFGARICRHRDEEGHDETYVQLGSTWLVLPEASVDRPLLGDHIAFRVSKEQLAHFADKLARLGHRCQMARNDTALYFMDFDNHVFELECVGLPFQA
ncbi:VOC family protein [Xanthomonas massiliensis]|uniref:VOC family protein n=1 Tax=Xanthomonas massiliensis TaxID=1720302 RepID=UPI000827084D|nr:VOC family protein [Xanthomonas massiliensis]